MIRRLSGLAAVAAVIAGLAVPVHAARGTEPLGTPPAHRHGTLPAAPNVVFILADDQRWDALWAMPTVQSELVAKGMTFQDSFVVNPLCCPSRSSILTGQYSHTTGIYSDSGTYGGYRHFKRFQGSTVAVWLQAAGYHTALIGKYLNGYQPNDAGDVPPGWDRWVAMTKDSYFGPSFSVDGTSVTFSKDDYSTDVLANYASAFIDTAPADQPLFLYFAPHAPHWPATPPPRYETAFADLPPYRPPSFDEADVTDKPSYIQAMPRLSGQMKRANDRFRIGQYASSLAIDDAVKAILDSLATTGRLANTLLMYSSDNGITWGEHRIAVNKNVPYEESIRVPLVARWDGVVPAGSTDDHLVVNVDLAETWAQVAGVPAPGAEGTSLVPLLTGVPVPWRSDFLIEHGGGAPVAPPFCAVRGTRYVYADYFGVGEEELYDLRRDPYELQSVAADPRYASTLVAMRARAAELCVPLPPTTGTGSER